jgi:transcriptional regulator with XRE-family HTH domain
MTQVRQTAERTAVGAMLAYWRKARHKSQLALATEAEISPRHLCFVETGRARPSREMVLLLASALDVPLRERNALLVAAGFAPVYRETSLDAPELGAVRAAIAAILAQQEPYPAVVMNRGWDIVATNTAAERFFAFLLGGPSSPGGGGNVLRLMLGPAGVRGVVANWDEVADSLVRRVHRELVGGVQDEATAGLLEEILAFPGVAAAWRRADRAAPLVPVIPVRFEKDGRRFSYFSAVTVLGTPQDITAQEVRIECFFPADEATAREARNV